MVITLAKKKEKEEEFFPMEKLEVLEEGYIEKLETDAKYSLRIDPENKYNLSDTQKDFIKFYVQWKNIPLASQMAGIDKATGIAYYNSYPVKMEIRRISLSMYHRGFATRMLNMDEIGGYLTSLLVDENIAEADKLNVKDKLGVVKMLMEINDKKSKAVINPDTIIDVGINEELEKLSIDDLHRLIDTSNSGTARKTKEDLIEKIKELNDDRLSAEEVSHLSMMTVEELRGIVERLIASEEGEKEHYEN